MAMEHSWPIAGTLRKTPEGLWTSFLLCRVSRATVGTQSHLSGGCLFMATNGIARVSGSPFMFEASD